MVFLTKRKIVTKFQICYSKHFIVNKSRIVFVDLLSEDKSSKDKFLKLNTGVYKELSHTMLYGDILARIPKVNMAVCVENRLNNVSSNLLPLLQLIDNLPEIDVLSGSSPAEFVSELMYILGSVNLVVEETLSFVGVLEIFSKEGFNKL